MKLLANKNIYLMLAILDQTAGLYWLNFFDHDITQSAGKRRE